MAGKKIAFVGGGQLAQMLAQAGQPLGMSFRSAGAVGSCAFATCEAFTQDLHDDVALDAFLQDVDVFTFESEHEGLDYAARIAARRIPIYPSADFVSIAGDRFKEKSMLDANKIPVAKWRMIPATISHTDGLTDWLKDTWKESAHGIVIKTCRGGYDGKGQWTLPADGKNEEKDLFPQYGQEILPLLIEPGCIVEDRINFEFECSIIATRSIAGEIKTWPLTHNIHRDSILRESYAPITHHSHIDDLETQAIDIVTKICNENNYVGTIAIECFVTHDGLIVNEIAPRVHNSGHWTIEGSTTSQFEQHVRAITGMELEETTLKGFSCMINLIGRTLNPEALAGLNDVYLHLYNKEVRPGRKIGHITIVAANEPSRDALVNRVLTILEETSENK